MEILKMVKRGVSITVTEDQGKFQMALDGETYETHASYLRGEAAWYVSDAATKKHFNLEGSTYLKHETAKKILEANQKKINASLASVEQQRKDFYGIGE